MSYIHSKYYIVSHFVFYQTQRILHIGGCQFHLQRHGLRSCHRITYLRTFHRQSLYRGPPDGLVMKEASFHTSLVWNVPMVHLEIGGVFPFEAAFGHANVSRGVDDTLLGC